MTGAPHIMCTTLTRRGRNMAAQQQPVTMKVEAEVQTEPRIEKVSSSVWMGWNTLTGHMSDGTTETLFGYYVDELVFSSHELVGLTAEQARELRFRRDVAYLRS